MAALQTREHVTVQHDIAFGGIHKQRADVITLVSPRGSVGAGQVIPTSSSIPFRPGTDSPSWALSSPNGTEPSGDQAKEHQLPLRASIPASWLVGLKYGIDSAA